MSVMTIERCPHCGFTCDAIATDIHFGYRVMKGVKKRQSWCRPCRRAKPADAATALAEAPKPKLKVVAPTPAPAMAPVPAAPAIRYILTADKQATRDMFSTHCPDDEFGADRRAWKFMARQLRMVLGDALHIDSKALKLLGD